MGTKMKGLLKGLRYISQMFDEEKEQEMHIGYPTDVKHVAHIGWDGPSVNTAPSWMNNFRHTPEFSSGPLPGTGEANDNNELKWVSEGGSRSQNSTGREMPEPPKSSRRPSSERVEKARHSRRQKSAGTSSPKDSSDGPKPSRQPQDSSQSGSESPSRSNTMPDIPKSSRRKKSKDSSNGGSTRPSRSKPRDSYNNPQQVPPISFSDPGVGGSGSISILKKESEMCTQAATNLQSFEEGGEKGALQLIV